MLRISRIPLALFVVATANLATAQEPAADLPRDEAFRNQSSQVATSGLVMPTVEMWFYEQEQRRYDDPKLAVRRAAQLRAQQRRDRLAAMRWYGVSNSRPMVSPQPAVTGYSAYWGSNSYNPLRWCPVAPTIIVARPTDGPY